MFPQSEAPLLIRPLIGNMTRSELHAVMTGGFATIAGTVLGAYISFGVSYFTFTSRLKQSVSFNSTFFLITRFLLARYHPQVTSHWQSMLNVSWLALRIYCKKSRDFWVELDGLTSSLCNSKNNIEIILWEHLCLGFINERESSKTDKRFFFIGRCRG